jgi:acyl-coenzyme A thioesterase PaaI-like protein
MAAATSPYDPGSQEATYWQARQRLASATRALNEKLVSTDIDPELAAALTEKIEGLAAELSQAQQVTGLVDMAKRGQRGTIDDVMGELVSVGGRSHPCSPELRWQEASNRITGTVKFSQAFEGPPGHVHGGWVAGVLDHLMGMTHVRTGHPGMTGGLSVRYLKPTPLNQRIEVSAQATELDDKRTEVKAEMRFGETTTAKAEAIFVRVDREKFGFETP